jgi:vitamin B12 transporter
MTRISQALALVAGTAMVAPAAAQTATALDEIIFSGARLPISASAYGRAVTVLRGEDLARQGITTVQQAIRAAAGVAVNGTDPYSTQVRIRGGEGNHVLVLIDGVAATPGDNGEYYFSGLETADIARIEVLRGPQSVLYGSNAASGVIAIITRRAESAGRSQQARLEAASDGSLGASYAQQFRGTNGELALALQSRHVGGFDVSGDGGGADSSERSSLSVSGSHDFAEGLRAGFTLRLADQSYDFDDTNFAASSAETYIVDADNLARRRERLGSVWLQSESGDGRLRQRLTVSGTGFDTDTYDGTGTQTSQSRAGNLSLGYLASLSLDGQSLLLARQRLSFVAEHESETFRRATGGTLYARQMNAVALEYQGSYAEGLEVQAGIRRDFNRSFADATSWNLAVSRPLGAARLHASLGKAVVNPSLYEQFGFVPSSFIGNPALTPEHSLGGDLGLEFGFAEGRGRLDVTLFAENLRDEITVTGWPISTVVNAAGTSQRRGVEVGGDWQISDRFGMGLAYTYTHSRSASGAVEVRRPRHELTLDGTLSVAGGRGDVTLALRHVAGNYDTQFWGAFPTVALPDYTRLDLSARYRLNDRVEIVGRIDNLTDIQTTEVWGYATAGRVASLALATRW